MYPGIAKRWINECSICHSQGYKPDLLQRVDGSSLQGIMKRNLMCYFGPLSLNEIGLCESCAKHIR